MDAYKKKAITFITPTHNGAGRLSQLFKSIQKQNYPNELITHIVVDDSSTDNSYEIAKQYGARVYKKQFGDAQKAKKFALDKVKTEYFIMIDDDHRLVSRNWIRDMIAPLQKDKKIIASFAKFVVHKNDPPVSRLLSFDPLQRDPIYMPFSPSFDELTVKKGSEYDTLEFTKYKQLPAGQCVWRTKLFEKPFIKQRKKYMELDILVLFARHGYTRFAFVHSTKIHHLLAISIKEVCRKRIRNIQKNYLYQPDPREYTWFDITNPKDIVKILLWILFSLSFVVPFFYSVYLTIKHKDTAGLWYGPLAFAETVVILFEFSKQFVTTAAKAAIVRFP